jgi:phosphatidylinositol glycan class H protein
MRRPLPRTHPELEIRPSWPLYVEYRVNNWRLAKDGTGRVRRGFGWSFWDIIMVSALVYLISHPSVGVFHLYQQYLSCTYPFV